MYRECDRGTAYFKRSIQDCVLVGATTGPQAKVLPDSILLPFPFLSTSYYRVSQKNPV